MRTLLGLASLVFSFLVSCAAVAPEMVAGAVLRADAPDASPWPADNCGEISQPCCAWGCVSDLVCEGGVCLLPRRVEERAEEDRCGCGAAYRRCSAGCDGKRGDDWFRCEEPCAEDAARCVAGCKQK